MIVTEQGVPIIIYFQKLDLKQLEKIALNIIEALIFLHSQVPTIIHRDINPENILIVENGENWKAVLFGFENGIVKDGSKINDLCIKLPWFAAPEIRNGDEDVDDRCDTFSLGRTILFLFEQYNILNIFSNTNKLKQAAKKMASEKPSNRPALESVLQFL